MYSNQQFFNTLNKLVMNDIDEEGFQVQVVETLTQTFMSLETTKDKSGSFRFKVKPPLCVHHQIELYQYPKQIDSIKNIVIGKRVVPTDINALTSLLKRQDNSIPLCDFFPRNLECVYNKFREKLAFKRDLTLIIRNVARQVRDEQVATFDSTRHQSKEELSFSSDFECGNLHLVFRQRKQDIYYLLLQNDVNTHGFNFWFYFNVRSTVKKKCKFIIANISRAISFEKDVSILTYSATSKKLERNLGFATVISQFCRCDYQQNYWGLLFEYEFDCNSDVYFSLTLPYSYSKMINFFKELSAAQAIKQSFTIQGAAKSPLGNIIPMVKILKEQKNTKKIILITGRQHPSETVSSFICQSMMKLLCQKNELSDALLQRFRFIILPLINVDGVIHGNSRTNLMGYDLNRCWDRSGIIQSIQCQQIWKYLQSIQAGSKIIWSFDMHGHSRQPGFFAFFSDRNQKNLIMAHHLSTKSPIFREEKCSYEIGFNKRESIRGQLHHRMKVKNTVTIQVSLFGYYDQNKKFIHYQANHFDEMANCILESLLQTQRLSEKKILKQSSWQEIIQKMEKTQSLQKDIDSDSDPENDYLKKQERKEVEEVEQKPILVKQKQGTKVFSSSSIPNTSQQKRLNTWQCQNQKCKSQRSSPSRLPVPIKIQIKKNEQQKSRERRFKMERNEIYNLTFTNRFLSSRKNNRSQELSSNSNRIVTTLKEEKKIQTETKEYSYDQPEKSLLQSQSELKKSLDMRKRIKLAFQNRHKTQRSILVSNLIDPINVNKINTIVYPTIKQREKLQIQSNLKSKKQLTKELRNQSYGISLQNRFQNSFYLKEKHQ